MPHLTRQDKKAIEEATAKQGGNFSLSRFLWEGMTDAMAPPRVQTLGIKGNELFDEIPVSFSEFMRNYFGEPVFKGPQEEFATAMYGEAPGVWDITYEEGIALWGMGSGKDWLIRKLVLYGAYWMMCLRDPQKFFNQGKDETLDIINTSLNAELAKNVFFTGLKKDIRRVVCPQGHSVAAGQRWFETWGMDLREGSEGGDLKESEILFPKNIRAFSLHSKNYSFEGKNIIIAVFDEIAAFNLKDAADIHEGVSENMTSRFGDMGKRFLLSYKRHDFDYMMIRHNEGQKEDRTFTSGPQSTWEVNKKRKKEHFAAKFRKNPKRSRRVYMCLGSGIDEEERFFGYPEKISITINKDRRNPVIGNKSIIEMPRIAFYPWFKGDPSTTYALHLDLATSKEGVYDCAAICLGHAEEASLVVGEKEQEFFKQVFTDEGIEDTPYVRSLLQTHPRLDPSSIRKISFRAEKPKETATDIMDRVQEKYTRGLDSYSRKIIIDFYAQLIGQDGKELQLQYVEELVEKIRKLGFRLGIVTADQWQSKQMLQNLSRAGIRAERRSTKNDYEANSTVKSLIYTGMIDYYYNSVFIREAEELAEINGKVDHPEKSARRQKEEGKALGSSDVWESVVGCAQNCFELPIGTSLGGVLATVRDED